jgi:FAD:protein FMN transferase
MAPRRHTFEAIGSHWELTIWDSLTDAAFAALTDAAEHYLTDFEHRYSRFKSDSIVSRITDRTGTFDVGEEMVTLLRLYQELYEPTNGKLNPLIGHTISDLGYDATYSLTPQAIIRETPPLSSLEIVDATHITLHEPCLIDLGALGKGFLVDYIADLFDAHNLTHYLVNGSGDVRYRGPEPLVIGIEDPRDTTRVLGTYSLETGAFASSGINRRAWREYHHIIDPTTRTSRRGTLASWVAAPTALRADAYASALFFGDPERLKTQYSFAYCVLSDRGVLTPSSDFTAEWFAQQPGP